MTAANVRAFAVFWCAYLLWLINSYELPKLRNYLVAHGVPEDRLVLENDARSTYENLLFSKPLAKKNGWDSLFIVTHDYHAPRAADIAKYLGYTNTEVLGFKSQVLSVSKNQSREVLAYAKWKLDSVLLQAGLQSPDTPF